MVGPLGCVWLFFIGCSVVYFGCLCVKGDGSRSVALHQLFYANVVQHATTPGFQHAEKTSFVSTNAISEREGGGPGEVFGRRIADLCIYLPCRSVFWRIVFDWLPSDTKRAVSCEMHQDFGANVRVPPKNTSARLENASSALSLPNTGPGSPPSLSVHYLCIQSVLNQSKAIPLTLCSL